MLQLLFSWLLTCLWPAPPSPVHRCVSAPRYTHHPSQPAAGPCGPWTCCYAARSGHSANHAAPPPSHSITVRSAPGHSHQRERERETSVKASLHLWTDLRSAESEPENQFVLTDESVGTEQVSADDWLTSSWCLDRKSALWRAGWRGSGCIYTWLVMSLSSPFFVHQEAESLSSYRPSRCRPAVSRQPPIRTAQTSTAPPPPQVRASGLIWCNVWLIILVLMFPRDSTDQHVSTTLSIRLISTLTSDLTCLVFSHKLVEIIDVLQVEVKQ